MNPKRWQEITKILNIILDLPEEQRAERARLEAGEDFDLAREVLELAEHDDDRRGALGKDWDRTDYPVSASSGQSYKKGDAVHGFSIRQHIGEGGMGEVYRARQENPIRRTVAMKFIKKGMDTAKVLARFAHERQAIGLLSQHPNIATAFEAGETEEGRPYFVMEFVEGRKLTSHCNEVGAQLEERIRLFRQVCSGVQHAHQKGLIHRDLKPGNILVATVDGEPVPKIIDFGLTQATETGILDTLPQERRSSRLGTLPYMAPEQVDKNYTDIDTRSDVFSLGVVLYELLTGVLPFDWKDTSYEERLRQIREVVPPRPAERFGKLAPELKQQVAAARGQSPAQMEKSLNPELAAVLAKALEKDRERRYDSVFALSEDLRRYLHSLPVEAVPAGKLYRTRKFAARNRGSLGLLGLVLAIAIPSFFSVWQAKQEANAKSREARAVHFFISRLITANDPGVAQGKIITVVQMLENAYQETERPEFQLLPARSQALHLSLIGFVYRQLSQLPRALKAHEKAKDLLLGALGEKHPDTLRSYTELASTLQLDGQSKEAGIYYSKAYTGLRKSLGAHHRDTLLARIGTAEVLLTSGKADEATPVFREVLSLARSGGNDPVQDLSPQEILRTQSTLARSLADQGDPTWEEQMLQTLQEQEALLGEKHIDVLFTKSVLAACYVERYQPEAEEILEEINDTYALVTGEEHQAAIAPLENQLILLRRQAKAHQEDGNPGEAEERLDRLRVVSEKIVRLAEGTLGPNHERTLKALASLARTECMIEKGDFEQNFRKAISGLKQVQADDTSFYYAYRVQGNLAECLTSINRAEEAVPLLDESIEVLQRPLAPSSGLGPLFRKRGVAFLQLDNCDAAKSDLLSARKQSKPQADSPQGARPSGLSQNVIEFEEKCGPIDGANPGG